MRLRGVGLVVLASVFVLVLSDAAFGHQVGYDQWTQHDTLCSSCSVDQGNQVGMWQTILWDDGFLSKCGSAGVDGHFGSNTTNGTKSWQNVFGLTKDGVVGNN